MDTGATTSTIEVPTITIPSAIETGGWGPIAAQGETKPPRKVAIVGSSNTSRHLAPYDDFSWDIWTLNDMHTIAKRFDRHFELHSQRIIEKDKDDLAGEIEWLKSNITVPVYMAEPADWVPMAVQYPTETIVKEFGSYFTNSISWMIALAIYEGVDELGIWGVDMAHGTEYAAQRPSCEYMIGIARGRGIPVFIPEQSDLLKCAELYGLETSLFAINLANRRKQLEEERRNWQTRKTEALINESKIEGAIEILSYVQAAWTNPGREF